MKELEREVTNIESKRQTGVDNLFSKRTQTLITMDGNENDEIVLASYIGLDRLKIEADSRVDDEDIIHVGNIEFKVFHTPGHTKGSICLYCENEKSEP